MGSLRVHRAITYMVAMINPGTGRRDIVRSGTNSAGWVRGASLAAAVLCFSAGTAKAGVDESRFVVSPDGASVDLELRDVPRREVLERLFAGQSIKVEWVNREVAQESVSGNFVGARSDVIRQLLQQTNFVLTYTGAGASKQVARVLVLGRASEGRPMAGPMMGPNVVAQQFMPASPAAPRPETASGKPMPTGKPTVALPQPTNPVDLKISPRGSASAPAPPMPVPNAQPPVPIPVSSGSGPIPMPNGRR